MTYERAHLKAIQGYTPGQQPDKPAIKLNTNENPYPPGPAVAHALSSFPLDMLQRYPDPLAGAFRASVARLHRLAPANVIATNGGDELLRLALTTFLDPGKPLRLLTPSYSLYSVLATSMAVLSPLYRLATIGRFLITLPNDGMRRELLSRS
jgi:histidinol-phosphate aminotransferase